MRWIELAEKEWEINTATISPHPPWQPPPSPRDTNTFQQHLTSRQTKIKTHPTIAIRRYFDMNITAVDCCTIFDDFPRSTFAKAIATSTILLLPSCSRSPDNDNGYWWRWPAYYSLSALSSSTTLATLGSSSLLPSFHLRGKWLHSLGLRARSKVSSVNLPPRCTIPLNSSTWNHFDALVDENVELTSRVRWLLSPRNDSHADNETIIGEEVGEGIDENRIITSYHTCSFLRTRTTYSTAPCQPRI